jgi:hypothetical protein
MSMAGYLIMAVVTRTTHISAFSGVQLSRYPISIFVTHRSYPLVASPSISISHLPALDARIRCLPTDLLKN